jgi:heme/copper-type cytochrome/quinol oxidase subunit 3
VTTGRRTLDVSTLAPGAFGYRTLMWWGLNGLLLIESTAFALAIAFYFYLRSRVPSWPPDNIAPPNLLWGSVNTIVLIASCVPNELAKRAAFRIDLRSVRLWLLITIAFGLVANGIRAMEFTQLNVTFSDDAYGSVVWLLLGLHFTHLLTDVVDSLVLIALLFIGPVEEMRFSDVADNQNYWYFVVASWLPIYGVIYWAPRII